MARVNGSPIYENAEAYGIQWIDTDLSKHAHLVYRFGDDEDVGLPFAYAEHRTANPYTVLELLTDRGRTGFDGARDTLARWRRTGVLVPDPGPALWVYEIASATTRTRGVVGVVDTADVDDGQLLEHEDTVAAVTAARVARLRAVPVDLTPVTAVHLGAPPSVQAALTRAAGAEHGQEMPPEQMQDFIGRLGRTPRQRTTFYGAAPAERMAASLGAPELAPLDNTPATKFEREMAAIATKTLARPVRQAG